MGTVEVAALAVHVLLAPLVRPNGTATARAIPGSRLPVLNDMTHDLPPTRWAERAVRENAVRVAGRTPVGSQG